MSAVVCELEMVGSGGKLGWYQGRHRLCSPCFCTIIKLVFVVAVGGGYWDR